MIRIVQIRDDAKAELDKVVKIMKDYPNMRIEIGSHTDCTGSEEYNLKLSDDRAKSSARYIQKELVNQQEILLIYIQLLLKILKRRYHTGPLV